MPRRQRPVVLFQSALSEGQWSICREVTCGRLRTRKMILSPNQLTGNDLSRSDLCLSWQRPFTCNQSCREVTCFQPGYRELVCVEEASTCCATAIKSVGTTRISLSRSESRSARSSKNGVCREGGVRFFSSNQLTHNQAHSQ